MGGYGKCVPMHLGDLTRLLDVALHQADHRVSLTVTEPPIGDTQLHGFLSGAISASKRHSFALSEIQVSRQMFPKLGADFRNIPVTDSGDPGVLRLIYGPEQVTEAWEQPPELSTLALLNQPNGRLAEALKLA